MQNFHVFFSLLHFLTFKCENISRCEDISLFFCEVFGFGWGPGRQSRDGDLGGVQKAKWQQEETHAAPWVGLWGAFQDAWLLVLVFTQNLFRIGTMFLGTELKGTYFVTISPENVYYIHNSGTYIPQIYTSSSNLCWGNRTQRVSVKCRIRMCMSKATPATPMCAGRVDTGGLGEVLALSPASCHPEEGIWTFWVSVSFSRKQERDSYSPRTQLTFYNSPILFSSWPWIKVRAAPMLWGGEEALGRLLGTTAMLNVFVLLQLPKEIKTSKKINKPLPFILDFLILKRRKRFVLLI